jgi:hypothetical protein
MRSRSTKLVNLPKFTFFYGAHQKVLHQFKFEVGKNYSSLFTQRIPVYYSNPSMQSISCRCLVTLTSYHIYVWDQKQSIIDGVEI